VNHELSHPAAAMFPKTFEYKDEIYQYKNYTPDSVRVLISLDMGASDLKRPYHVPIAWVRDYGSGRLFYTNFGHNRSTWQDPRFQDHLLQGIRWALNLIDGPSAPNPEVQHLQNVKSFLALAAGLTDHGTSALHEKLEAKAARDGEFLASISGRVESFKKMFDNNNRMGQVEDWNDEQSSYARKMVEDIAN
jgi:hypothetical protein